MELILKNDDHNTLDHVIDVLMTTLKYTHKQATQCTLIVHYRGHYKVYSGNYDDIILIKKEFELNNLNVEIR